MLARHHTHRGARSPFKTTESASLSMPDDSEASRRPSTMTWSPLGSNVSPGSVTMSGP